MDIVRQCFTGTLLASSQSTYASVQALLSFNQCLADRQGQTGAGRRCIAVLNSANAIEDADKRRLQALCAVSACCCRQHEQC
jgi:hypothetical protein